MHELPIRVLWGVSRHNVFHRVSTHYKTHSRGPTTRCDKRLLCVSEVRQLCACAGPEVNLSWHCFSGVSPLLFQTGVLTRTWSPHVRLVSLRRSPSFASPVLGLRVCVTASDFLHRLWGPNSNPLACQARALLTGPCLHPLMRDFDMDYGN